MLARVLGRTFRVLQTSAWTHDDAVRAGTDVSGAAYVRLGTRRRGACRDGRFGRRICTFGHAPPIDLHNARPDGRFAPQTDCLYVSRKAGYAESGMIDVLTCPMCLFLRSQFSHAHRKRHEGRHIWPLTPTPTRISHPAFSSAALPEPSATRGTVNPLGMKNRSISRQNVRESCMSL